MTIKIAINGFGRIGRLFLRALIQTDLLREKRVEVVAVNDIVPPDNLAYLLSRDSTHGPLREKVSLVDGGFSVEGQKIFCFQERSPDALPWKKLGVHYVIESTGLFTDVEGAKKHLEAGAKRVIISAPAKGDIPTFVLGVNEGSFDPTKDQIVSNASCTTNCLAPLVKVIHDHFGIEEGLMTTVHALTATQPTVDGPSKKDWRGGRGALQNTIPASTGAAKAVTLCLPALKGKLTGMAFRVPVADVSVVDLTVRTTKKTTFEALCNTLKKETEGPLLGIYGYTEEEVVSSDFIGSTLSGIFDKGASIALNDQFFKLIAWYDNEMGYSHRLKDLLLHMARKEALIGP